jgi:hypothetical protein
MNCGWRFARVKLRRDPVTGLPMTPAAAAAFDKAADLRSALFGEQAQRLAALGTNEEDTP